MPRTIGSMKTLSMEIILEEKRRQARAARNRALNEQMRADLTWERAFENLCGMRGLNVSVCAQKQLNFA